MASDAAVTRVWALDEEAPEDKVPAAAQEWQSGWRWGWRYAIQAVRRAVCGADGCGYPNCWHPEHGCARFAALDSTDPVEDAPGWPGPLTPGLHVVEPPDLSTCVRCGQHVLPRSSCPAAPDAQRPEERSDEEEHGLDWSGFVEEDDEYAARCHCGYRVTAWSEDGAEEDLQVHIDAPSVSGLPVDGEERNGG